MRALCKDWTEGGSPAFAVLDGVGDWTGDNQLCITQEGHTPVPQPVDDGHQLDQVGLALPVVDRPRRGRHPAGHGQLGARAPGSSGGNRKVGVVAGNRASDQVALNQYLLPDLRRAGITPIVKTIAADPSDTATTDAEAPLVVQQLRSDGVTSVIPLIPFNVFFPVLEAETPAAVLPPAPAVGLRGRPSSRPSGSCPSPTTRRSTARRG